MREFLKDPQVPDELKEHVVQSLDSYAVGTDADSNTLSAAIAFAHTKQIRLKPADVERAAPYSTDPEHILWQLAALKNEMSGQDIKHVLGLLGGNYSGFNGAAKHEFDIPVTASTNSVLDRLKQNGLVELPRGGPRRRKKVRIL